MDPLAEALMIHASNVLHVAPTATPWEGSSRPEYQKILSAWGKSVCINLCNRLIKVLPDRRAGKNRAAVPNIEDPSPDSRMALSWQLRRHAGLPGTPAGCEVLVGGSSLDLPQSCLYGSWGKCDVYFL